MTQVFYKFRVLGKKTALKIKIEVGFMNCYSNWNRGTGLEMCKGYKSKSVEISSLISSKNDVKLY